MTNTERNKAIEKMRVPRDEISRDYLNHIGILLICFCLIMPAIVISLVEKTMNLWLGFVVFSMAAIALFVLYSWMTERKLTAFKTGLTQSQNYSLILSISNKAKWKTNSNKESYLRFYQHFKNGHWTIQPYLITFINTDKTIYFNVRRCGNADTGRLPAPLMGEKKVSTNIKQLLISEILNRKSTLNQE